MRERTNLVVCPADGVRGDPPHLEGRLGGVGLGQHPLVTWVFINRITNEFILGPDILCVHDVSMDVGCCVLQLDEKEVSL